MRLSARSWDRVPRMTTLWWSSRPHALFVNPLFFEILATSFYFWRVRGDICVFLPFACARGSGALLPTETGRLSSASWHEVAGVILSAEAW